jgi:hypothetical protein
LCEASISRPVTLLRNPTSLFGFAIRLRCSASLFGFIASLAVQSAALPNATAFCLHPPSEASGRVGNRAFSEIAGEGWRAVDVPSVDADAPPQPRYRGLTLPKLRLGRMKMMANL